MVSLEQSNTRAPNRPTKVTYQSNHNKSLVLFSPISLSVQKLIIIMINDNSLNRRLVAMGLAAAAKKQLDINLFYSSKYKIRVEPEQIGRAHV